MKKQTKVLILFLFSILLFNFGLPIGDVRPEMKEMSHSSTKYGAELYGIDQRIAFTLISLPNAEEKNKNPILPKEIVKWLSRICGVFRVLQLEDIDEFDEDEIEMFKGFYNNLKYDPELYGWKQYYAERKEAAKVLKESYFKQDIINPGIVKGDFDGTGLVDYAVLLRKCKQNGGGLLVVFLQKREGIFQIRFFAPTTNYIWDSYIQLQKPGEFEQVGDGEKVKIKNDSILWVHPQSSVVIYWQDERFNEFWIWSD